VSSSVLPSAAQDAGFRKPAHRARAQDAGIRQPARRF